MLLCPTALYRPEHATPICLKAHHLAGQCTGCQSHRVRITEAVAPSLLSQRVEYGRERVRDVAKLLAGVFSDDSRAVLELCDVADELGAVAMLHRGQG